LTGDNTEDLKGWRVADYLAWKKDESAYFAAPDGSAEAFQKPSSSEVGFELVGTSWHGFSIPEANIHRQIYY
jgi:hypothetical protein